MPYATYQNGVIVTLANQPQGHEGEVEVDETHPDVIAFLAVKPTSEQSAQAVLENAFSVDMLDILGEDIAVIKTFLSSGTPKALEVIRRRIARKSLPAELEDERQALLQLFGG